MPSPVDKYHDQVKKDNPDYSEEQAWATAWSIYCVVGDTLVSGSRGVQPIANLVADTYIEDSFLVDSGSGPTRTSHGGRTGVATVTRIRTKHGFTLGVTGGHLVKTLDKETLSPNWTAVQDLCIGDHLAVALLDEKCWPVEPVQLTHTSTIRAHNAIKAAVPSIMTPELARLLGYIVSEGTVASDRIAIPNNDVEVVDDIERCCRSVFGTIPGQRRPKGPGEVVDIWQKDARDFLLGCGLQVCHADGKTVPWSVLQSPRPIVVEFLKALFEGDGFAGNRIELGTKSATLAQQVQVLLLKFGVFLSIRTRPDGFNFVSATGGRSRQRYMESIGFVTHTKTARHQETSVRDQACKEDIIPGSKDYLMKHATDRSVLHKFGLVQADLSLNFTERHPEFLAYLKEREPEISDKVSTLLETGWSWDAVVSLETSEEEVPVYDLTVPGPESFVANGLVVHNCKHKNPGSPHCKKPTSEYLKGKSAGIIVRVASRALQARDTSFLLSDHSGEPGGGRVFWPEVPGFKADDLDHRYDLITKVSYESTSEDVYVSADFNALFGGDDGGHWVMRVYGERQEGTWKHPDDIATILHKGVSEARQKLVKAEKALEALCGRQWELSFNDTEASYKFKDHALDTRQYSVSADVTFYLPLAIVLEPKPDAQDYHVTYFTEDWTRSDKGSYRSLQDMKRVLDNAAKWFRSIDEKRL